MLYVLYNNAGVLSGRALRETLAKSLKGVQGGFPSRYALVTRRGRELPEMVVNLGTTENVQAKRLILNGPDCVRKASNKRASRIAFRDADVPIPPLYLNPREITQDNLPVVGRTSYHHKGQGFWLCRGLSEVARAAAAGATHFMGFIPNTREYRVHTFIRPKAIDKTPEERVAEDYRSVKISEKVWTGQGQPDPNTPQKNHDFGWTFLGQQNRREEELDLVRQTAKRAIAALGVDFGAVDIMYHVTYKNPYVLEVNSTPSLADENADTCERYAKQIVGIYTRSQKEV